MNYKMTKDFLSGRAENVARVLFYSYAEQAVVQIEDPEEACAEAERRAKHDVFTLCDEATHLLNTGVLIAVPGGASRRFAEKIDEYVTERRIEVFTAMNAMIRESNPMMRYLA